MTEKGTERMADIRSQLTDKMDYAAGKGKRACFA